MATSDASADNFSGRPNYDLYLSVSRDSVSGNSSRYDWTLKARQRSGGDTWVLDPVDWDVDVEGSGYSGSHTLDFRGSVTEITIAHNTTAYKAHNSDGYLTVNYNAHMGPASLFGSAGLAGSFASTRIPKAPDAPPQPTFVSSTSSSLTFTVAPPADNGGATVTSYTLELASNSTFATIVETRASLASSQTFIGLSPATTYYLRYRATNSVGTSANSTYRIGGTTAAAPSAPLTLNATSIAPTSATINWTTPASNGGSAITGYRITRAVDPGFTAEVIQYTQDTTLSRAFTDLLPSQAYYFKVEALNSVGYGPASDPLLVTTISGVYYDTGTTFIPAGVFVSDGTNWLPAELFVSNGTAWQSAI